MDSRTSLPIPRVIYGRRFVSFKRKVMVIELASFNSLTLACSPSNASSFWPSRSSEKRWPFGWPYGSLKGEERPEAGGVIPSREDRSRREALDRSLRMSSEKDPPQDAGPTVGTLVKTSGTDVFNVEFALGGSKLLRVVKRSVTFTGKFRQVSPTW